MGLVSSPFKGRESGCRTAWNSHCHLMCGTRRDYLTRERMKGCRLRRCCSCASAILATTTVLAKTLTKPARQQGARLRMFMKDKRIGNPTLLGSMADAGCSCQLLSLGRHASRFAEKPHESHPKHCLMHGQWPPAATVHASGTSVPPPTRRCADRTRSLVWPGLTNPTEDRSWPVPQPLPPPTAVARALERCGVAGWIRRCGRESSSRCRHR